MIDDQIGNEIVKRDKNDQKRALYEERQKKQKNTVRYFSELQKQQKDNENAEKL